MGDLERAKEIAGKLSYKQQDIILSAQLADCHEYWLTEELGMPELASSDWVLRPLGLAVRRILEDQNNGR